MLICKIGQDHLDYGTNKQDAGLVKPGMKVVVDGCGSSQFSEIGANLFIHSLKNKTEDCLFPENIYTTMDCFYSESLLYLAQLNSSSSSLTEALNDCFTFTFISCIETEEKFLVQYSGDGFIITQNKEGIFGFKDLDNHKEYTDYYVYKFLANLKIEPKITLIEFPKSEYKKIGIASDGLRYLVNESKNINLLSEFKSLLLEEKEVKMARFINRNQNIFRDDITIAW